MSDCCVEQFPLTPACGSTQLSVLSVLLPDRFCANTAVDAAKNKIAVNVKKRVLISSPIFVDYTCHAQPWESTFCGLFCGFDRIVGPLQSFSKIEQFAFLPAFLL
jgi:hypothetical protein